MNQSTWSTSEPIGIIDIGGEQVFGLAYNCIANSGMEGNQNDQSLRTAPAWLVPP